ncbi:16S rRNA (cytidine(1402)-2'-O)-methyltransferase [Legionella sp. MW5194]|uniref:16S rRNA (cytidine(1402)-2'-O)-methyltransferase n=1 Tax=Legionella sp. MW5194 TaxID=2662448 RepID=UPI00193DECCB|nr:16S rRNA (cytidine(1402)-2'-O)-methyltransferase [Legionella sp. MW5194]QRN04991.1 16S rRNA (cytidine(1402)-2'-O)-methyltransferase [Legionella sp. MW5194]
MDKSSASSKGCLYIVATPIGNLDDISLRAINTLKQVDTVLAEDTRHSGKLLHALGIDKPLISHHAHNEGRHSENLIAALLNGKSFALISDAGTPLISDPGFELVRQARAHGIEVVPIPGPCAVITALSAAGVPCDTFTFLGFLPAKQQARREQLKTISRSLHTTVIYESTHRIHDCIDDIEEVFGPDYAFVLAKELTKAFEQFIHAHAPAIRQWLMEDNARSKGEFVLIFPAQARKDETGREDELLQILLNELPLKQAVKLAAELSGSPKNELYKLALKLQKSP